MADSATKVSTRAAWADDPLGYMIAPYDRADFFNRIYEREAIIIHRDEPNRYTDLLSIDGIDRLIAGADLSEGQLDLANAINPVDREMYISESGLIDRGVIARQFQGGSTIIMQQLHQHDPVLADFCRAIEHIFSAHTQTNIYLTPPEAQGFRTHYDNHCVFILQIEGEKRWRLYNMSVDAPYRGEGFSSKEHPVGDLQQEFVLKAGDCAYVPRGLMHDATTSGTDSSLHITVGLIVKTWADLILESVSEVALKNLAFRRALPAGYANADFDRTAMAPTLRELSQILAKETKLDGAFELMADSFIRSRAPNTFGAIKDAPRGVQPMDRYVARAFTPWRLAEDEEKLVLIAPGGEVDFTPPERAAIERALDGRPFSPGDLPDADNELIRKLQAFGLIMRAS
ncbi:MAG: cupin domain-containing protein [Hyphomonadaceae bacterium]